MVSMMTGSVMGDSLSCSSDVDLLICRVASDPVVRLLLAAGIEGAVVSGLPGRGELNAHWLVRTADGRDLVARVYGWPFPGAEPFDRCAKEAWLLGELSRLGAPVPVPVVAVDGALLMTRLPGVPLGEAAQEDGAWRAAGAALRVVHELGAALVDRPGMVVAGGVDGYGWGRWQEEFGRRHAEAIAARRPDLKSTMDTAVARLADAVPLLDAAPVTLLHGDPHPWNVLVDRSRTGWLDWEFALAGDAEYDLTRAARSRLVDLGPTPASFFDGYGRRPDPDREAVYELVYYLQMADDSFHFAHRATYDAAWRYLETLA
jgi:Ser/Thr protein kinase RdoA (MazF antagonist)